MGLEGIIAKRLDAAYKGVRDETWLKIKCQRRQEFVVGGFAHRAGSGKEVGTLMLGVYDEENRLRYAGSVGTGWKSAQAVALLAELTGLETDEMPFHSEYPPTKGRWSKREAGGERWAQPRVSGGVILIHCVGVKLTHLGDDGGLLAAEDTYPGAGSGDQSHGPAGHGNSGDSTGARLLA
jgi:ATP-dependent DNA ligase